MFSPYREIKEPNAEVSAALQDLLVQAKRRAEPTFIFVNNRLEGSRQERLLRLLPASDLVLLTSSDGYSQETKLMKTQRDSLSIALQSP